MTCLFCRLRVVSLLAMAVFGVATGNAVAQPTGWVFEVHAGSMPDMAPGKVILQQLPPPGPGFTTPDGNVSRRVASWYFGDGSTLANSVADKLGGIPHIAPLDSALTTSALTRTSGGVTGFRIGHTITRRVLVLLSYDQTQTRVVLTPSAQATIAATNASYKPYWDAWLAGPQVGNISTSSAVTFAGSEGTQRMISVAAEIRILTIRGWTPYVALGGGVSLPLPAVDATVTLLGHYEATLVRPGAVNNGAQVSETDQVQVRYELEPNGIGIFGAGVERSLARHLGVRAEVRSFLSANMIRTRIDTRPISGPMAPPFVNFRGGVNPDLQVSTTASPTSLSLLGVDHFDSFRAKGNLPTFIAGVFLRF